MSQRKFRIALVSDFFCPNTGGIETHLYFLSKCLLEKGHHVIMLTRSYGKRKGIYNLSTGLKVYYLPIYTLSIGITLPTACSSFPWIRNILKREDIEIIHGHSSFSSFAGECLFWGRTLNLKTILTDHSLMSLSDLSSVLTNKLYLRYIVPITGKIICVSYAHKENIYVRCKVRSENIFVIPNAIDSSLFLPDKDKFYGNDLTIVVACRLVYRKGADLLKYVIPKVCSLHSNVKFLIAGDGPKRVDLEEMREKYNLFDRVAMIGMVPHNKIAETLVQGQIFLNTSLTEAFCIAIVEAASCGLHVISTRVGGVSEVLPENMLTTVEVNVSSIVDGCLKAIKLFEEGKIMDPEVKHELVKPMYNWENIAARTEIVYEKVMTEKGLSTWDEICIFKNNGLAFGLCWIGMCIFLKVISTLMNIFYPISSEKDKKKE
uniref:GlcNAc-PI synthesis protein n=1 Tax=Strongyloides venezuelensis TaxID=75913 RepID=A0A0K0F5H1_STRVS